MNLIHIQIEWAMDTSLMGHLCDGHSIRKGFKAAGTAGAKGDAWGNAHSPTSLDSAVLEPLLTGCLSDVCPIIIIIIGIEPPCA